MTARLDPVHVISVRGWTLEGDKTVKPAPKYALTILQPPSKEGEKAKVLAKKTVQPDESWYRPDPTSDNATVTIELDK